MKDVYIIWVSELLIEHIKLAEFLQTEEQASLHLYPISTQMKMLKESTVAFHIVQIEVNSGLCTFEPKKKLFIKLICRIRKKNSYFSVGNHRFLLLKTTYLSFSSLCKSRMDTKLYFLFLGFLLGSIEISGGIGSGFSWRISIPNLPSFSLLGSRLIL